MTWSVNNEKCMRCGGCVGVCPAAALELTEFGLKCGKNCTLCGNCEKFCPVGAIKVRK